MSSAFLGRVLLRALPAGTRPAEPVRRVFVEPGARAANLSTLVRKRWSGRRWQPRASGRRPSGAPLLDPGGLLDIDLRRFIAWGMGLFAGALAPLPIRRRIARRLHTRVILDKEMMQMARLAYRRTDYDIPDGARALTDAQLRAVRVPTLALLAEHSSIMDPAQADARVRSLMPDVVVEIVPDAGHGLPFDDAERVAARLRRFLDAHDGADRRGPG